MIINATIKNFMGIEKEVSISCLVNNKLKRKNDYCIKNENNENLLKVIGIIGCNGSGKTSLLKAIATIQTFITFPYRKSSDKSKAFIEQIKNMPEEFLNQLLKSMNTLNLPSPNVNSPTDDTKIELELYIPADKKNSNIVGGIYTYRIIYDSNYIVNGIKEESLYYRKKIDSKKVTTIFSVNNVFESEVGTKLLYENNTITSENKDINYYRTFGNEIMRKFEFLFSSDLIDFVADEEYLIKTLEKDRKRFIDLCNLADDKITDVIVETVDDKKILYFVNNKNNRLKFEQLSSGTKKIILYGNHILFALENNKCIFIDEIENSLHPMLTCFLLSLVGYPIKNSYSQVFFTTHSVYLSSLLDNDQLYYIDNRKDTYNILNISTAIKNNVITKDKSLAIALLEELLIKNPNAEKISEFINNKKD